MRREVRTIRELAGTESNMERARAGINVTLGSIARVYVGDEVRNARRRHRVALPVACDMKHGMCHGLSYTQPGNLR